MNKRIITAALIISIGLIGFVVANTDTKEEKKVCTAQEKECCKKELTDGGSNKTCCKKNKDATACEGSKGTCEASGKKSCSKSKEA